MSLYTEEQVLAVLQDHHYTTGDQGERHGFCSCKYAIRKPVMWSAGHVTSMLRQRYGR